MRCDRNHVVSNKARYGVTGRRWVHQGCGLTVAGHRWEIDLVEMNSTSGPNPTPDFRHGCRAGYVKSYDVTEAPKILPVSTPRCGSQKCNNMPCGMF